VIQVKNIIKSIANIATKDQFLLNHVGIELCDNMIMEEFEFHKVNIYNKYIDKSL